MFHNFVHSLLVMTTTHHSNEKILKGSPPEANPCDHLSPYIQPSRRNQPNLSKGNRKCSAITQELWQKGNYFSELSRTLVIHHAWSWVLQEQLLLAFATIIKP